MGTWGSDECQATHPKNLSEFPSPFSFRVVRNIFWSVAAQPVFSAGSHTTVATPSKVIVTQLCSIDITRPGRHEVSCVKGTVVDKEGALKRQDRMDTLKEKGVLLIGGHGFVHVGLGEISPRRAHCAWFLPTSMAFASPRIVRLSATVLISSTSSAWLWATPTSAPARPRGSLPRLYPNRQDSHMRAIQLPSLAKPR